MALFNQTLNTLKKKTTEIFAKKDEDLADGQASSEGFAESVLAEGGPLMVRYFVQNVSKDEDRDGSVFPLDAVGSFAEATVQSIRANFPLTGIWHFRFKTPTPGGIFGGFCWQDVDDERRAAPQWKGEISMKALRIADNAVEGRYAAPVASAPGAAGFIAGLESLRTSPAGSPPLTPKRGQAQYSPPARAGTDVNLQPFDPSGGAGLAQAPPLPTGPPADLMEMGETSRAGASPATSSSASPRQATPLEKLPSREVLVAQRLEQTQRRMTASLDEATARRVKEEADVKEKQRLSLELGTVLDKWAKVPDGSAFKDIRTLLCSMHEVTWANSSWAPLSLSELVAKDSNVKRYYQKAIVVVHPDKQPDDNMEQVYRADRIFHALNEAFKAAREGEKK